MKKFISIILVLTLLITTTNIVIPISAFAENDTSASAEIPILTEEAVMPEATTVAETETVDEEVTLELMEEKRVMLMSYGNATVTGKVVDSNGNGINKVSISVYDVTEQISIGLYYTGSNGTWTFDDAIQGNTYVFRYYHPLYDIANDTVETTVEYASVSLPNATATKIYDEFTETDASKFTYSVINGLYIKITGYTGNDSTVVIPNTIDGYTVQSINSGV
ncbi:MAG: hypothetical protein IJ300_07425, partial [Clostridia bacterium]|nr:hypothetical protein [Clostridia bacterium]